MESTSQNWFAQAFGSLGEISPAALAVTLALAAAGIVCLVLYLHFRKQKPGATGSEKARWTTKEIATAALCVAGSFALSFIRIFPMPFGGSITPASMLPVMAFAYIYGFKKGLLVGFIYSLLQFIQEPIVLSFPQVLMDYTLAFTSLGLAGLAKKSIIPGIGFGCAGRFVCQFFAGVFFWGMYAPEGMNVWLYSLGYSGLVVGAECAICMAVAAIPALSKTLNRAKAQAAAQRMELQAKAA